MNFNFLQSPSNGGRRKRVVVTAQSFFESEGNPGYMSKPVFNNLMAQTKEHAPGIYKQYQNLFVGAKEGFAIANPIQKQTHLTNQSDYYHLRFKSGRQVFGATVYEVERIGQFVKDYASGLIETNFTIEELIEESNK